jgi:uncharacterized protein
MRGTNNKEIPISFLCGEHRLYGILHRPAEMRERGILMVNGRPALRAGRHRLFLLLARSWLEAGIPVMRFDFRGTGDSEGEMGTLEETAADLRSAVDAFISNVPGLQQIVLWGLCGGAADAILYAPNDSRVGGLVLANPWSYDASVRILTDWRHRMSRQYSNLRNWIRSIVRPEVRAASATYEEVPEHPVQLNLAETPGGGTTAVYRAYCSYRAPDLSKRLVASLARFSGNVLFIFSGADSGSRHFKRVASISPRWRRVLSSARVQTHDLADANHSLRRPEWRAQAAKWTLDWLKTF